MSDQIKSLQDVINTQPGSYVSGGFQAVVTQAKSLTTKSGKTMFKAVLTEGPNKAYATSFSTDFSPCEGKLMKWVGMGIKRGDDYQGQAQVSIGDKARWIPIGEAPAQAVSSPANASGSQGGSQHPAAPQNASGAIAGVTVGMAINKAVDIALNSEGYSADLVWRIASDLIRVSERLQRGELAVRKKDSLLRGELAPENNQQQSDEESPF